MPRKKEAANTSGNLYPDLEELKDEMQVQHRSPNAKSSTTSDESDEDDRSDINENRAEDQPKYILRSAEARRKLQDTEDDSFDSTHRAGTPRRRPSIHRRPKLDTTKNVEPWWKPYLYVFVAVGIVFLVAITFFAVRWIQINSNQQRFHKKIQDPWKVFTNDVKLMRDSNSKAFKDVWPVVMSAFREVLNSIEPNQPGILVILYDEASVNTKDAFVKNLTSALAHAFEQQRDPVEFFGETYAKASDVAWAKKRIDERFRTELNPLNSRIALFHDANLLPSEAALLFISYADHQNAPVKDSALIITLKKKLEHDNYSLDRQAELLLESAWSPDLKPDTIAALQSRLAVNVIAINSSGSND